MTEQLKSLGKKTVSVSKNIEVGIPFGKSYYKPTPKLLRIIGDGMLAGSLILSTLAAVISFPPSVLAIGACAGIAGKYISNCFSTK